MDQHEYDGGFFAAGPVFPVQPASAAPVQAPVALEPMLPDLPQLPVYAAAHAFEPPVAPPGLLTEAPSLDPATGLPQPKAWPLSVVRHETEPALLPEWAEQADGEHIGDPLAIEPDVEPNLTELTLVDGVVEAHTAPNDLLETIPVAPVAPVALVAVPDLDSAAESVSLSVLTEPELTEPALTELVLAKPVVAEQVVSEPVLVAAAPVARVALAVAAPVSHEPVAVRLAGDLAPPMPAVQLMSTEPISVPAQSTGPEGRQPLQAPSYVRTTTEEQGGEDDVALHELLLEVIHRGASDLHLTANSHPMLRISGSLQPLDQYPVLNPSAIRRALYAILTQKQREKFEEELELDLSYSLPGEARFRLNIYKQREALGAAFRIIPYEIKSLEALGIPASVSNFAMLPRGFVLVTGPTGSGKSTTLAALVDMANRQRRDHIMTVEDPIEFLHTHQQCLVNQREVGEDTWSFGNALKHVLRQDPDIILVGEMRDLETISVALTAAETGHLVFATLHTQDAAQTIDRVIDVFPPHQQQQVRVQLASSLQGVVCQTLARTADGRGRVAATEVLVATPAVRNLIREGKTHQIYSTMQAGAKHGMHTMDQHLAELVMRGRISYEVGLEKCHHVEDFNRLAGRG